MGRLEIQDAGEFLDTRSKQFPELDSSFFSYKLAGGTIGLDVPIEIKDLEIDEKNYSLWVPIADGNARDGVGDLLEVAGIDTSRHIRNPICLLDHAKSISLPIARARENPKEIDSYSFRINPAEKTAGLRAYFYTGKEKCDPALGCKQYDHAEFSLQVFDMMAKGFINAGSIGYQIIDGEAIAPDYNRGIPQGMHLKRILMLEGSAVVLPANSLTVVKNFSNIPSSYPAFDKIQSLLTGGRICGKPASPYLVKALEPYRAPSKSTVISGWKSMQHPVDCKCSKCMKKMKSCSCSSCSKGHACPCETKHIEKSGDGYDLVSKKTGKVLGHHPTREAAVKQEQAIEANKHGKAIKHPDDIPTTRGDEGADWVNQDDYTPEHMSAGSRGQPVAQSGGQYTRPEYQSRMAGYQSRLSGQDRTQNPHKVGTPDYFDWHEGWDDQHFLGNPETYGKSLKALREKYRKKLKKPKHEGDTLEVVNRRQALNKIADTVGKVITGGAAVGSGAAAARDYLNKPKDKSLLALRMKYLKKDGDETKQPSQRRSAKIVGPGSGTSPGKPASQQQPSQRRSATVDFGGGAGLRQAQPGKASAAPVATRVPGNQPAPQAVPIPQAQPVQQPVQQEQPVEQPTQQEQPVNRREALTRLGLGLGAAAGATGIGSTLPLAAYLNRPLSEGKPAQTPPPARQQQVPQQQSTTQPQTQPKGRRHVQEQMEEPAARQQATGQEEWPSENVADRQVRQQQQQEQNAARATEYGLQPNLMPDFDKWISRVQMRDPAAAQQVQNLPKRQQAQMFLRYANVGMHRKREELANKQRQPGKHLMAYEQKGLDLNHIRNLRHRYRRTGDKRMRVLRHGKPTHVVIHTSPKNLDRLRKEAGDQGVEVKWLADDGKGITKVKLSGSKNVLDKFANAYGKKLRKKK